MDKKNIYAKIAVNADKTRINLGDAMLQKYKLLSSLNQSQQGMIDVVTISGESVDKVKAFVDNLGGSYEDLGHGFGVARIPQEKLGELLASPLIQYAELPVSLYTSDEGSNRASCVQRAQTGYSVSGKGVLIGFVDSGIDYTHQAFKLDNGDTRIEYIYDLSQGGKIFSKDDINNALKSSNPYEIVNSRDITEHGTHVAGIACAGGKINPRYYGAAPESSIMMVKVTRGRFSFSNDIMKGLKFLLDKSKELGMPLIINISMSTNDGAHNGTSLLEQYIQTLTNLERVTICIASGNEGDSGHHAGGILSGNTELTFNIASDERAVVLNLYKSLLPRISIELISSTGKNTGPIEVKEGIKQGLLGNDEFIIYSSGAKPFDILGEISIGIRAGTGQFVSGGNWTIRITVLNNYIGEYDVWLPIAEGLNQKTKFLQPNPNNTLGIPATVQGVISVGSYNHFTNNISSFSGRGRIGNLERIKPDLVAPGEDIFSTVPDNGFDTKTGTSMASPQVAGICALITEWAIVKKNDIFAYGERLKYYLLQGCRRNRTDVNYPNNSWGYGEVCAYTSMEVIVDILSGLRGEYMKFSNLQRQNVPGAIRIYSNVDSNYNINNTVGVLVKNDPSTNLDQVSKDLNAVIYAISNEFAIVFVPVDRIKDVKKYVKEIFELDVPELYTLNTISPIEASQATAFFNNPYLDLTGDGVLVGIVDTGIDYLNREFINEDNTTRIISIWDQNIQNTDVTGKIELGTIYTENEINQAIALKSGGKDPYSLVATKDENGHGTKMASIIAAKGYDPLVRGVLPNSKLVIVNLKELPQEYLDYAKVGIPNPGRNVYSTNALMLGVGYLSRVAKSLDKPMVIYVPLGTNIGAHDGTATLEGFINGVGSNSGIVVTTSTGNEGDTETHVQGTFSKPGEEKNIELKVGKDQVNLSMQIYARQPDIVAISVISPSGESIDKIPVRDESTKEVKFVYEGTKMTITYYTPDYFNGDEVIIVKAENIREGIWRFKLTGEYIVDGRYWAWIPQRKLLSKDTKFLNPSPYTTLTIPSTAESVISAAFYNQNNNAVMGASGRGFTRDERVKPDIAAGGIEQDVTTTSGKTEKVSGSSVAGAVVAGCVGLLLQWGVVNGNDRYIYTTEVRSLIIRGAYMRSGDTYPNPEWGYGGVDMRRVFEAIRGNLVGGSNRGEKRGSDNEANNDYDEYYVRNIFVRKPKGV